MTLNATIDPDCHLTQLDRMLSWQRLEKHNVRAADLIRDSEDLLCRGLNSKEAFHLFYGLGGVMNAARLYQGPERFHLRNFTLAAMLTWLDKDFQPDRISLSPKTIGKIYAAFNHVGARLPKKAHQLLRDKIRDMAGELLPNDGMRILEYYAATADHLSPSVFEVIVKAIEVNPAVKMMSRQVGFLNNLALIDSQYDARHFTDGYQPKDIYSRNVARLAEGNIAIGFGKADTAKKWFDEQHIPLNGGGLIHRLNVQDAAKRLESLGFKIYSDFNCCATGEECNGVDFHVGKEPRETRVGVIFDTSVKFVEGISFPRILYPSGRAIFNSAVVQRKHPDQVIVRLSTIASNKFETAVIGNVFDRALTMPSGVYGIDGQAELQPIRKLSFGS